MFLAIALVTTAFATDTNVKATNTPVAVQTVSIPAPVSEWVFGVNGGGTTATKDDLGTAFGMTFDIGRTGDMLFPIQFGLRQSLSVVEAKENQTLVTSALYNDWTVFSKNKIDLFAGANVALTYGDTKPLWVIAPEAGVRYWVKNDIAIVGRVQYGFDLSNNFKSQDSLAYTIGLQFKF